MSKVTKRDGIEWRPSWNYSNRDRNCGDIHILEMTESIRNACEQIRDSQALQCDVALAIKDIAKQLRGLRRDLKAKKK